MAEQNSLDLMIKLRSEWIKERDSHPPFSREALRLWFGIYALDEAVHSLEEGKVWRYSEKGKSLDFMLHQAEI